MIIMKWSLIVGGWQQGRNRNDSFRKQPLQMNDKTENTIFCPNWNAFIML